jgi:hypothetical protein
MNTLGGEDHLRSSNVKILSWNQPSLLAFLRKILSWNQPSLLALGSKEVNILCNVVVLLIS